MTRNVSTPGFAKLGRQHSQISNEDSHPHGGHHHHYPHHHQHHPHQHIAFGIECGSSAQLSNTQLYLEPSSAAGMHIGPRRSRRNSRRDSRPIVRPMYRKDVFYSGSVSHLLDVHEIPPSLDQYRHSVISIPRFDIAALPLLLETFHVFNVAFSGGCLLYREVPLWHRT